MMNSIFPMGIMFTLIGAVIFRAYLTWVWWLALVIVAVYAICFGLALFLRRLDNRNRPRERPPLRPVF